MAAWTDQLFDKLAKKTNLGQQTLEACRRVLVAHRLPDGTVGVEKGSDVAVEMGLYHAQISRSVSNLRKKRLEMGDISDSLDYQVEMGALTSEVVTSRDLAVNRARELFGEHLVVRDVEPGMRYIGKPLIKTPQHLVQGTEVAGVAVIHDLAKMQRIPDMNAPTLDVKYPTNNGLAEVREIMPGQTRGGRSR